MPASVHDLARDLKADIGYRLMTVKQVYGGVLRRCFSSHPDAFPIEERRQLLSSPWADHVLTKGMPWLGPTRTEIAWAFPDHLAIFDMGCGSCITLPIRNKAATVVGTLNLFDAEGFYGPADLLLVNAYHDRCLDTLRCMAVTQD